MTRPAAQITGSTRKMDAESLELFAKAIEHIAKQLREGAITSITVDVDRDYAEQTIGITRRPLPLGVYVAIEVEYDEQGTP